MDNIVNIWWITPTDELNGALRNAELVRGLALENSVLLLLDRQHPQRGRRDLVGQSEMADAVVLVARQHEPVLEPRDGRLRVGLDVALKVHVVLKGLPDAGARDRDHGGELDVHGHVPPRSYKKIK